MSRFWAVRTMLECRKLVYWAFLVDAKRNIFAPLAHSFVLGVRGMEPFLKLTFRKLTKKYCELIQD